MSARKALTHDGRTQSINEWSEELGIPPKRLYDRIRQGWTVDDVLLHETRRGCRAHRNVGAVQAPVELAGALKRERAAARALGRKVPREMWDVPLDRDPWAQCLAEVAREMGGFTLDEIGHLMGGLSRERVRQVEEQALRKAASVAHLRGLRGGIVEMLRGAAEARDDRDDSEKGGYDG